MLLQPVRLRVSVIVGGEGVTHEYPIIDLDIAVLLAHAKVKGKNHWEQRFTIEGVR